MDSASCSLSLPLISRVALLMIENDPDFVFSLFFVTVNGKVNACELALLRLLPLPSFSVSSAPMCSQHSITIYFRMNE